MSDTVISVENLSKSYLVGHEGPRESYQSLRDTVVRHGKNYVRKAVDMARGRQIIQGDNVEEFWALKDISFEVKHGEVLGIIGRNGAGKSTLLKILSRITEPTAGRVILDGRVASLLEVGTGFHPELTGRENIFLNGAILGMSKIEIKSKFDEIVAFAEVERFLDTPVKRFSSGMYVRLAFAVAAHLEPEILVIDEVLAVGDSLFQKKCLGKMQDVAKSGRTVLFVSHNLHTVSNICSRCVFLENGKLKCDGSTDMAIEQYTSQESQVSSVFQVTDKPSFKSAHPYFELTHFSALSIPGSKSPNAETTNEGRIEIIVEGLVHELDPRFNIGIAVYDETGQCVFWSLSTDQAECDWPVFNRGLNRLRATFDIGQFNSGKYMVNLVASLHCVRMLYTTEDDIRVAFEVLPKKTNSPYWTNRRQGALAPQLKWQIETK